MGSLATDGFVLLSTSDEPSEDHLKSSAYATEVQTFNKPRRGNTSREHRFPTPVFDFSKRRATDCVENKKVHLPKMIGAKEESQLEMLRSILWEEYIEYKKELINKKEKEGKKNAKDVNQEGDNLTRQQREGLKKLKKRIAEGEILNSCS